VAILLKTTTILQPPRLDPQIPDFYLVLHVSLAYKVFLDHPQNFWVGWRGSHPPPVGVSNKQNIYKNKYKNNSKKTRVSQTRLD
jgi:hypothetical protein